MSKAWAQKQSESRPTANIKDYAHTADILARNSPEFWKLICPRRYVPPPGYFGNRVHSISMAAHLVANEEHAELNKVLVDCLLTDWKLIELGVPTYYLAPAFAEDLMMTEPPKDMILKDLLWAHDAMVFMLPESFQQSYFGRVVPFITICKTKTGKQAPPAILDKHCRQALGLGLGYSGGHGVIASASVFFGDFGIDYSASYSEDDPLSRVFNDQVFHDDTQTWIKKGIQAQGIEVTEEEDIRTCQKIMALAVQLVIAMSELPEHLAVGPSNQRPERTARDGSIKKEGLWVARMFGGTYTTDRPESPGNGTHASPRLHRRRGHWRREMGFKDLPEGVKPKMTWIKPMWIGA